MLIRARLGARLALASSAVRAWIAVSLGIGTIAAVITATLDDGTSRGSAVAVALHVTLLFAPAAMAVAWLTVAEPRQDVSLLALVPGALPTSARVATQVGAATLALVAGLAASSAAAVVTGAAAGLPLAARSPSPAVWAAALCVGVCWIAVVEAASVFGVTRLAGIGLLSAGLCLWVVVLGGTAGGGGVRGTLARTVAAAAWHALVPVDSARFGLQFEAHAPALVLQALAAAVLAAAVAARRRWPARAIEA